MATKRSKSNQIKSNQIMLKQKKTLCLVMIVRNEAKIIERCLNRVKDHIDYWVIVDTGSDDETMDLIRKTLAAVPGELHQRPWVNFGVNRSESLALAKGKADYLLLCDADEQIIFSPEFDASTLDKDGYMLSYQGANDYAVTYLIRGDLNWRFVGVTHEYITCDKAYSREKINTISILDLKDGGFKADKFERDIRLLTQGLIDEPDNARYQFYLANSYRDIQNYEKAAEWYQKRIASGGWKEEVTVAYENLGAAYESLKQSALALHAWLKGYDYNPKRLECLYRAVRLLRIENNPRLAYHLAMLGKKIPYPKNDLLFIKRLNYELDIYYEISICAYYVQDFKSSYECCRTVLCHPHAQHYFDSTVRNLTLVRSYAAEDSLENIAKLVSFFEQYLAKNPENEYAKDNLSFLRTLKHHHLENW